MEAQLCLDSREIKPDSDCFPFWLKSFLFFLPLGFPLFSNIILCDFFLVFGIIMMIITGFKKGSICFQLKDIAWVAFLGFSFLGIDILFFPKSFFLELGTLMYLFLGSRAISNQIKNPSEISIVFRKVSFLFFPLLAFLSIFYISYLMGIEFFTSEALLDKLHWPYRFPNQLGAYLLMAFPLALGSYRLSYLAAFLCYLAFILVLSAIGSRSCFLLGYLEIFFIELFIRDFKPLLPKWIRFVGIIFLGVALAFFLAQEGTFLRAIGAIKEAPLFADTSRLLQVQKVFDFSQFWFTGIGLGCFKNSYIEEVHNIFLSLLVETGIGGLFMFLVWVFLSVWPLKKLLFSQNYENSRLGKLLFFVLSMALILGMVHNLLRNRFLWFLIGLPFVVNYQEHGIRRPAHS